MQLFFSAIIFSAFIGPYGGDVRLLYTLNDNRLLCGTTDGFFVSDTSFVWDRLGSVRGITPSAFFQVDDYSFIAGFTENREGRGLWISKDKGFSWEHNTHLNSEAKILYFYSALPSKNEILIFTAKSGLFKYYFYSDEVLNMGSPVGSDVNYVCSLDTMIAAGTPDGIYVSYDAGNSWQLMWDEDTVYTVYLFMKEDTAYLAFSTEDNIYTGNLNSSNFSKTGLKQKAKDFLYRGDTLFVLTERGVWITPSLTEMNWTELNKGFIFESVNVIDEYRDEVVCGASDGIYVHSGNQWIKKSDSLKSCIVSGLLESKEQLIASSYGSGIMKKSDKWYDMGSNVPYVFDIDSDSESNIIYGASNNAILRGLNYGESWELSGISVDTVYKILCYGGKIYIGTDKGLYQSDDGVSFTNIYSDNKVFDISLNSPDTIFIATPEGIYRSVDGGITFVNKSAGLPDGKPVVSVDYRDHKLLCSFGNYENGIYISEDNGENWRGVFSEEKIYKVKFSQQSNLVYGLSYNNKLFLSVDSGRNFEPLELDIYGLYDVITDFNNGRIYTGGRGGVSMIVDTTPPVLSIDMPEEFSPEGDGVNDSLVFDFQYSSETPVAFWGMVISKIDSGDTVYYGYVNDAPSIESWDGYDLNGNNVGISQLQVEVFLEDALLNKVADTFIVYSKPVPGKTGDSLCFSTHSNKVINFKDSTGCIYTSGNPQEVYFASLNDSSFTNVVCISNTKNTISRNPVVCSYKENEIVAWVEQGKDVDYLVAGIYGDSVYFDTIYTGKNIKDPSIVIEDDKYIYLSFSAFSELSNSDDIYLIKYDFTSGVWDEFPQNLTDNSGTSSSPSIFYINEPVVLYLDNTGGEELLKAYGIDDFPSGNIKFYDALQYENLIYTFSYSDETGKGLIGKYDSINGWVITDTVPFDMNIDDGVFSVDSVLNFYLVLKNKNDLYLLIKDHEKGWQDGVKINEDIAYNASLPDFMKNEKVFWLEKESISYEVKYEDVSSIKDTVPPDFMFSIPDTIFIGDTLDFNLYTEVLRSLPYVSLIDKDGDTLLLKSLKLADFYEISGIVKELSEGEGKIFIRGFDLSGNEGSKEKVVYISSGVNLVVDEKTYVYPNPVQRGTPLYFKFITGENADVKVYFMDIEGNIIRSFNKKVIGGVENELIIETAQLGYDIYVVVLDVRGEDTGRKKKVIKKFIVK